MRSFKYGDEKISGRELMIALPSIVISVDILSLPKEISNDMNGSDGWIVLLVAGGFSAILGNSSTFLISFSFEFLSTSQ